MPTLTVYARATAIPDGDGFTAKIVHDTFKCRLAWIDAPEMSQPWGPEARATLYHLIHGQELKIIQLTHDKYGRVIVAVYDDADHLINEEMVRLGAAWYAPRYGKGPPSIARAAAIAKSLHVGLWACSCPINPRDHRATKTALLSYRKTLQRRKADAQEKPKRYHLQPAARTAGTRSPRIPDPK